MFRRRASRSLGIVALSLSLSASLAVASPGARPKAPATPVASARIGAGAWLAEAWKKVGCLLGPWGSFPSKGGELPSSEYGCSIDPGGVPRCTSSDGTQPNTDHGCLIDPWGVAHCTSTN